MSYFKFIPHILSNLYSTRGCSHGTYTRMTDGSLGVPLAPASTLYVSVLRVHDSALARQSRAFQLPSPPT